MPPDIRTGPMTLAAGTPPGRAPALLVPPGSDLLAALFASLLAARGGPAPVSGMQAAALKKSMLMRVAIVRIQTLDQRARTAIEIAREGKNDEEVAARLAEAKELVRAVGKEEAPWAAALAAAGTAAIAAVRRDRVATTEALRRAMRLFDDAEMALHAAAARRALGEWLTGDDGARLVREADAAMRAETVADPRKLARLLVPAAPVGPPPA